MEKTVNNIIETKDDLHSYIRHSMPGYVFIITVFVYWFISKGTDFLVNIKWESVLAIIGAGFPLGYLMQSVFRAVFVKNILPKLIIKEGTAIERALGNSFKKYFPDSEYKNPKEAAAWAFEMFLNGSGYEGYQKRWNHLIASIHAPGGAISAIGFAHLAVVALIFIKELQFQCCLIKNNPTVFHNFWIFIPTIFIFGIFVWCLCIVCADYINSHSISMRTFIASRGVAFEKFLSGIEKD